MANEAEPSRQRRPSFGAPDAEAARRGRPAWSVFFVANARAGIFWGTGTFMVATVISLIASRILFGRIPVMPLVSGVCVLVFGGLTLWLQDDHFIKIKPTIVNALFAGALFIGLLAGQSLLQDRVRRGVPADRGRLAQADAALGMLLRLPRRAQRDRLALVLDRRLGELQGVRHHAADDGLRGRADRLVAAATSCPTSRASRSSDHRYTDTPRSKYCATISCELLAPRVRFALDERAKLVFSPNRTVTFSSPAKVGTGVDASSGRGRALRDEHCLDQ